MHLEILSDPNSLTCTVFSVISDVSVDVFDTVSVVALVVFKFQAHLPV